MAVYNTLYSIPYLIVFFLFVTIGIGFSNSKYYLKEVRILDKELRFIILIFIFIFFIGLRGYILTDWINYCDFYDKLPKIYEVRNLFITLKGLQFEPGFILLSSILKTFSFNYFNWQLNCVLIDFFVISYFFKKNVPYYYFLGFLFFFCFGGIPLEFNLLRNSKSIMCFLLSYQYINGNKRKYFLWNIIGCTFHVSSLIYIVMYPFMIRKYNKVFILGIYFLGNLFFIFHIKWLRLILESIFSRLPELSIFVRLLGYTKSSPSLISFGYLKRNLEFLFIFFIGRRYLDYKENVFLYNSFFVYHIIYLTFYEMLVFVERLPILFIFSYWLLFPKIIKKMNLNNKKTFLFIFVVILSLYFYTGFSNILYYYDNALFNPYNRVDRFLFFEMYYN